MTEPDSLAGLKAPFAEMEWEYPAKGARSKTHVHEGRKIRLLEFSDGFSEQDWCTREHYGYVIAGPLPVEFQGGGVLHFETGAGIAIPAGTPHRHHGTVGAEGRIRLFLVEQA